MSDSTEPPSTPADMAVSEPSASPDGTLRPGKRLIVAIALGQFGNSVGIVSLVLVSYPITIAELEPANKATLLGLVMGLQSLIGIVAIPVFGMLSDRCTSRFGMRRPFMLAGTVVGFLGMLTMGLAPSIEVLVAGAAIEALGAGIYAGGFSAVVPDQVQDRLRGRVMGLMAMMTTTAGLIATLTLPALIGNQFLLFAVPGMCMLLLSLNAVFTIDDRMLTPQDLADRPSLSGLFAQFRVNPRAVPDFSWAWSGKVLVTLGNTLTSTYAVYILTDHLHVTDDDLPPLISATGAIGLVTAITGAGLGSWLSDRLRVRKSMALWTSAMVFAGAFVVAFAPSVPFYFAGLAVMGLGVGAYFPIDGAIIIDVLPGEGRESGKYMGLMQVADRLPRALGAFLAPVILAVGSLTTLGGYPMLYIIGGIAAIAGGLLIRKVKGSI